MAPLEPLCYNFSMRLIRILFTSCICIIFAGCAARRHAIAPGEIPHWSATSQEDNLYGERVLAQLSANFPPSRDSHDIAQTRRVVATLARAAGSPQGGWRVYVFADDQIKNAAATRGNYIFIWSGLLRVVQGDDELAAIIAHEMAHVLAQHVMPNPAEQLSEAMASVGGTAASQIIAGGGGATSMAAQLGGAIVEQGIRGLVINPESRRQEFEADQIGLFLMADAGFNPDAAVAFWERVQSDPAFSGGQLEFFSTHPSSTKRSAYLRSLLPAARQRGQRILNNRYRPRIIEERSSDSPPSFHELSARGDNERNQIAAADENTAEQALITALSARIFASDDRWSEVRDVVNRDEEVTIACRTGPFYQIIRPTPGFIDAHSISDSIPAPRCRK
jgi:Zn-dependent protease with chaperone function